MRHQLIGTLSVGLLAACGGGGSSDGPSLPVSVSFNVSSVTATFPEKGEVLSPPTASVTATVTNAPAGTVYAFILEDAAVLKTGAQGAIKNSDGTYTDTFLFSDSLAQGIYTGTLTLELCADSQCASRYTVTGGTLPYTITVTPGITFTATVNGAAVSDTSSPIAIHSGDAIALTSSVPVTWAGSAQGAGILQPGFTTTTYTGKLKYADPAGDPFGKFLVTATSKSTPAAVNGVEFDVSP